MKLPLSFIYILFICLFSIIKYNQLILGEMHSVSVIFLSLFNKMCYSHWNNPITLHHWHNYSPFKCIIRQLWRSTWNKQYQRNNRAIKLAFTIVFTTDRIKQTENYYDVFTADKFSNSLYRHVSQQKKKLYKYIIMYIHF